MATPEEDDAALDKLAEETSTVAEWVEQGLATGLLVTSENPGQVPDA
jgi:hypothetical protein